MIVLKEYISKLMTDESIFVSIGANDGVFVDEIFQSKLLNQSWKCFFVEPVKETFDKLIINYNKYYPNNSFTFINKALNTYNGKGYLVTHKADDSMGMCSFFRQYNAIDTVQLAVDCITFKKLVEDYNITNIDFLKIDTEGMDYEIVVQCIQNNIFPKIILLEHILISDNTVSLYNDMLMNISVHYQLINDIPEYQYEESNILLIRKEYV